MLSSPHLSRPRWADWLAAGLVIIFVISGILTLSDYGLTWDEGLGNLFFGERYYHYFLTFQEKYVDLKADLADLRYPLHLFDSPMRLVPEQFPAFTDVISAGSMDLLAYRLGWMDPVDAFHLPKVLMAGILLWGVYQFASRRLGVVAGLASLAFLGTFPRLWGDMHFNPKDVPETVFFGLTVFAFWSWAEHPGWRRAVLVGLAGGAAVATKANAVFAPFILAGGLAPLVVQVVRWRSDWKTWIYRALQLLGMALVAVALCIASWPYLYVYNSPVKGLTLYWTYILDQGGRTGLPYWNFQPLGLIITTMPEWMLLFVLIGIGVALVRLIRTRRPIYALLLAWLVIPIARTCMPGAVNFDGIRHYLEFLPAAALLAGLAAGWLVERLAAIRPSWRYAVLGVIFAGILINTVANFATFGRYQHLYFNSLIGGFPGAAQAYGEGEDTDYWAGSFRQAMTWLNANAPAQSHVHTPVAPWLVQLTAQLWLRPDIKFTAGQEFYSVINAHQPMYLIVLKRPSEYPSWALPYIEGHQPVHVISLQGVPLVNIYQVSP